MKQLTIVERIKIWTLLIAWFNNPYIAKVIWFSDRTIRRELPRWMIDWVYYAKKAQEYVDKWRRNNGRSRVKLYQSNWYLRYLKDSLERWISTPDSIVGRKKIEWEVFVCSKTIYSFIWLYDEWLKRLLTYQKRYKKHHSRQWKRPEWYRHISERWEDIEQRKNIWDMEIDLVMSKWNKAGIMTLIDRKSRFWLIGKVESKKNDIINKELWRMIKKAWIQKKLRTITNDNGHEFFWLRHIAKKFWFKQYYADPYSSQQRWTNEQYNWQIRKIFPKWTIFSKVPTKILIKVQTKLNRKPRKILWYKTPEEVFYSS